MTMLEKAAKAVCGTAAEGYCKYVGGELGCKRGRGEPFNGSNCVATIDALRLTDHWDTARAVLTAIRTPDEMFLEPGTTAHEAWQGIIDAILVEEPKP